MNDEYDFGGFSDTDSFDLSDLWGGGDIDFGNLTTAFTDADIEALANLGSGTYSSLDDAIIDYAEKSGQDLATAQQKFQASGLTLGDLPNVKKFSTFKNTLKALGMADESGNINPIALLGLTGLLSSMGQGQRSTPQVGYQGSVPKYTAVRERVEVPQDPNRRPGAGGRRYFSDVSYAAPGKTPVETQAAIDAARTAAKAQALSLKPTLYPTPQVKTPEQEKITEEIAPSYASGVAALKPVPKYDEKGNVVVAGGGLLGMARGRYLDGVTDGMEDKVPATISGKQPARLSHGEFVVPADVVSHLGNGNSNAGAQRLYDMMDRIRKARTGNPKQGKQINPNKYLPK